MIESKVWVGMCVSYRTLHSDGLWGNNALSRFCQKEITVSVSLMKTLVPQTVRHNFESPNPLHRFNMQITLVPLVHVC